MKILMTGGAGYIGSVLCEKLLQDGNRVVVVDNLMYKQKSLNHLTHYPNFDVVVQDVRNVSGYRKHIETADVLIPLAGLVGAPICDRYPKDAESVNFLAVRDLFHAKSKDQILIYPNTNSGYGTTDPEKPCTEDTPLKPISIYGKTKCATEKEIRGHSNVVVLRLATVFGASPMMRLDLLVNNFVYKAFTDHCLVLFEKDFVRNYVYVRDVADCFMYCMKNIGLVGIGGVYNLGNDKENMSKEQLALKIKKHLPDTQILETPSLSDPDKRNYQVSSQKLKAYGFSADTTLDDAIPELIKMYTLMGASTIYPETSGYY